MPEARAPGPNAGSMSVRDDLEGALRDLRTATSANVLPPVSVEARLESALAEGVYSEAFVRGICDEVCATFGPTAPGAAAMFDPDYVLGTRRHLA